MPRAGSGSDPAGGGSVYPGIMKFVHAADLHIDSPLHGLEEYPGAPVERVRLAPREALKNLVRICLDEEVAFLIISGDLFDYDWRDFDTPLFVVNQFRLLEREGIRVFLIRGNHDSREEMSLKVPWPSNVTLFDYREAETFRVEEFDVAVHGMSFAKREVKENLVPRYPPPDKGLFNIGLLHTNATGSTDHDPYAPCTIEDLTTKGYDYWALGHVHQQSVLHTFPHIVYSGNTQGRHIRECGEKGSFLLTVEDGRVTDVQFRPTDVLRWFKVPVVLGQHEGLDDLYEQALSSLRAISIVADGRLAGVRLEVRGNCAAHRALVQEGPRQEAIARLRTLPGDVSDELWIEKIKFETRPAASREDLSGGQDLIGDLLRSVDEILNNADRLQGMSAPLKPLMSKVGNELALDEIDFMNAQQLSYWLREAENYLLGYLTEEQI